MDKEGHLGSLLSLCPELPWCHPGVGDGSLSHHLRAHKEVGE